MIPMDTDGSGIRAEFLKAARNHRLVTARMGVLHSTASALSALALQWESADESDSRVAATALLARIAAELIGSTALLLQARRTYPAASLLRPLIETEYLLAAAGREPARLEAWLDSDAASSAALFQVETLKRDAPEAFQTGAYRAHRDATAHPHPSAAPLLGAWPGDPQPYAFLLPRCVCHSRRTWDALMALVPQLALPPGDAALAELAAPVSAAIAAWERREPAAILESIGELSAAASTAL